MLLDDYVRIEDTGLSCPRCSHKTWCLVARDGKSIICPRAESLIRYGEAGYYHEVWVDLSGLKLSDPTPQVNRDWGVTHQCYRQHLSPEKLIELAHVLGVSEWSLDQIGLGWDGEAWTFPIYNGESNIIGMQRRYPDGTKRVVHGSKMGVHIPRGFNECSVGIPAFIGEGASDLCVLSDLGFRGLSRLSCTSGNAALVSLCDGLCACVVADTGNLHEIQGAERLAEQLRDVCPQVTIYHPDAKDLREEVKKLGWETVRRKLCQMSM